MRFRVLGPVRVWDGTGWGTIRAAQQRLVLTIFLLEAGRVVSTERLIDEIWGAQPPQAATATVHWYVMRIRRLLGDGSLVTRGRGYELVIEDDDLDAAIFERMVLSGQRGIAEGKLEAAINQLSEGLALWQGSVAADVPQSPTVIAEITRLDQLRLTAFEVRFGAQLDLGWHAEVVDELRTLAIEHPLRERLWEQLMLALYRCGRRAEALEAYQQVRTGLVGELGLEPGQQLRDLQAAILADDPRAGEFKAASVLENRLVPAQLPPDVAGFTGRAAQCARLDALLPRWGDTELSVLVISTIGGSAGVGKTALAVHWAHRVLDRFPDGQLYADLRGYGTAKPLAPMEVLARFLHALGVPPAWVPVELDEAIALYRSVVSGKRMLLLLDNASHPDQVRPLLPSSGGCFVLVTSRDQLTGLVARDGAVRLTLDVLTAAEAQALLVRLLGGQRFHSEPEAFDRLAATCGYLPLALRIAAANLNARPENTVADYVSTLAGADRLTALEVEGDPQSAVRVAFDHSYAVLAPQAQRLFRVLGLVAGPFVTVESAAALADIDLAVAGRLLGQLASAYLVDRHSADRYGCHDLLRHYAAERAELTDSAADRRAAIGRLHGYYLRGVAGAAALLYPHVLRLPLPDGLEPAEFLDADAAAGWLDAERSNLVAAVLSAAAQGIPAAAWRLADAMRGYLYLRMYTVDWRQVSEAAVAAADASGDEQARAAAHIGLATLQWTQGKHHPAVEHFTTALALAQQAGWVAGESAALGNLGNLHWALGHLDAAADHYAKAQLLYQQTNQAASQATALGNLGLVYFGQGRLDLAESHCAQALALHREAVSRSGEARTLTHLGDIYHALGRVDDAHAALTEALTLLRALGDRNMEGDTIRSLAAVHRDAGRLPKALELANTGVELARDNGDRRLEAGTLTTRASVHHALGHNQHALDGHRQALRIAREIGESYLEVEALIGLAMAQRESGRELEATKLAAEALAIARHRGYGLLVERVV
jgi:DNA-binding SARP family transcriptional activator/tetratricopeptide (TPR) repeat protein